jgi:hypothetical protein
VTFVDSVAARNPLHGRTFGRETGGLIVAKDIVIGIRAEAVLET